MLKTVSIGIPALNEEANIKALLNSILSQKGDFELKEIIIFSDCSTDNTVKFAKEINDARIKIIENNVRVGQAEGQNQIVKAVTGDYLILLNADVLLGDDTFIDKIIQPFLVNKKVGIVAPRIKPLQAETFFEKIINFSADLKQDMFISWNKGNNIYMCCGRARAFSKDCISHIVWPTSSSEDAYSYLVCLEKGFDFVYIDDAFVLYRSPENFNDHVKQSTRFMSGEKVMSKYFPESFVNDQYKIPFKITLKSAVKYFFKNPILFLLYFVVVVFCKIQSIFKKNTTSLWAVSASSKNLIRK